MNKKIVLLVIMVLSLVMLFVGCSGVDGVITNGDFSSYLEKEKAFEGWQSFYDKDAAATMSKVVATESDQEKGHGNFIRIKADKYGYNYIFQEVKLEQGATYKLSVDIKTTSSITGEKTKFRGAWVGFLEDADFAVEVNKNTNNYFVTETKYFTPTTSKKMTFVVGIGSPAVGKARGTADFDNIVLEKVDASAVPAGTVVETVKYGGDKYSLADAGSTAFVVVGAMLSVLIVAAFIYVYRKTMSREMLSSSKALSPIWLFVYMMVIAFAIRFIIAILTGGMVSEINALSQVALKFNGTSFADVMTAAGTTLPAGMLYLLFIMGGIAKLLNIGGDGLGLLIRLPFILADLVAVYMIYNAVAKRQKEHTAVFVAGLYAVLPSIIMASTGWGMEISLVGCFLIGMCLCLLNKNYIGVTALFTVSLLFSNITILLLPLVLVFLIYSFVKNKDARIKIGISSLVALIAFYVLWVPFVTKQLSAGKPFIMFSIMFSDLVASKVLTANAFNLYGMIGMNLAPINKAMDVLNYIFVVAIMVATVLIYLKNRDRLNLILMSSFTLISVSTLAVRGSLEMMVLGIALLFVYAMIANSRRAYALVGGFSTLSFLNMALIMSNSGFISNQINASKLISFFATDPAYIIFSLVAVLMTLYLGYVVYDVCIRERSVEIYPLDGKLKDDFKTRYMLFKERRANRKNASAVESED